MSTEYNKANSFSIGEWEIKLNTTISRPKRAIVELTMKCNLNCTYCFRRVCSEPFGSMDEKTFTRIINELKRARVVRIIFSGWGEPLVHPKIIDYLSIAKNLGFNVALNTNGTMLKEYAEDIVRVGVDEVIVSIDAVEDSIYSKFRIGSVSDVIMGLYELYRVRKKYNSPLILGLAFTITTLNYSELPRIVKLANSVKAVYINLSNMIPVSKEMTQYACFMSENCRREIRNYLDMISRLALEYPIRIYKINFTLKAQRTCPFMAENALFIGWDGKLSPCLHYGHNYYTYLFGLERRIYRIIFGDISKESLISVWFKRDYHLFRYIAKTGYLPSCLDCDIAEYCIITRDNMMDCWGNSPTCAHCPFIYGLIACPL